MSKKFCITIIFVISLLSLFSYRPAFSAGDMVLDGMVFHTNMPPFSAKDHAIVNDVTVLDRMMREDRYNEARPLLSKLMTKIKSESPKSSNPIGEKYSVYTYQSLKYWQKKLPKATGNK